MIITDLVEDIEKELADLAKRKRHSEFDRVFSGLCIARSKVLKRILAKRKGKLPQ